MDPLLLILCFLLSYFLFYIFLWGYIIDQRVLFSLAFHSVLFGSENLYITNYCQKIEDA
jgi:hypothetical protein